MVSGTAAEAGRTRPRPLVLLVVAGLAVAVLVGGLLWTRRGVAGTSERVTLEWQCANSIFWPSDARAGGDRWWAGHDPVVTGSVITDGSPPHSFDPPRHEAAGTLRYDTEETATFHSDAGGTMPMMRQPPGRFYTTDCTATAFR
jgi:hypothetical protein